MTADETGFVATRSPLHGRVCFLVGAPRSGTTWVQQLLAAHPGIAASSETHMFDGLGALLDNQAAHGLLEGWVSRAELLTLIRQFADGVMLCLLDHTGLHDALVVEKTPDVPPVARHLAEVYPDAYFLHLVRDGRDVAYSLRQRFGTNLPLACAQWVESIEDIRDHLSARRFLEVRYEEIAADPVPVLERIFRWLDVTDPVGQAAAAVAGVDLPVNTDPSVATYATARRRAWPRWLGPFLAHETGPALTSWGYANRTTTLAGRLVSPVAPFWRTWERSRHRRLSPSAVFERRRQSRIDNALRVTDSFYASIGARDSTALHSVLAQTAELTVDGAPGGGGPTAEAVLALMDGWKVHARWAVGGFSMAELHPRDGGRAAVRLRIERGRVAAIDVTRTDLALHDDLRARG